MRRREFITGVCGATAAPAVLWSLAANAQEDRRIRRIGVLTRGVETDRVVQAQRGALRDGLAKLGWIEGRNLQFDVRLSDDDPSRLHVDAEELVRLSPDLIVVASVPATRALMQKTRTIPIVFTNVGDPVAGGLLKNIARPEGNATGMTGLFQSFGGKWIQLLKEAAPRLAHVALIFVPGIVVENYFADMEAAADALGVKVIPAPYRSAAELEHVVGTFAAEPNGALVLMPPPPRGSARELFKRLALQHRLPAIGANKYDTADEVVMMSYGGDSIEVVRAAASYIDRILHGAKISELPVQFPTKFELVINLKTAAAIDLTIPESLLFRADEVIK